MVKHTLWPTLYFAGALVFGAHAVGQLINYKAYQTAYQDTFDVERTKATVPQRIVGGIEALAAGFLLTKGIQKASEDIEYPR